MKCERLPFAPIEDRVNDTNVTALARLLRVERHWIYYWRRRGLTVERADELAVAVGHHPGELWPDAWWTV